MSSIMKEAIAFANGVATERNRIIKVLEQEISKPFPGQDVVKALQKVVSLIKGNGQN